MLIDSHCHLDAAEFDDDRDLVLARARQAGIVAQVLPAVSVRSWANLRTLTSHHPDLHPAYGLHPMFLPDHRPEHLPALRDWLQVEPAVAVGECGLDFWVQDLDRSLQHEYLLGQLRLAREFDLPVILHARKANDEVAAALRRIGGLRGVVHSFSGSCEQAQQFWKLGFLIGLGGPVTYPRARRLRELATSMPVEFLLLETDSPDQPLCGRQGRRNEPAHLSDVLSEIAGLREVAPAQLAIQTSDNARRLFGLH